MRTLPAITDPTTCNKRLTALDRLFVPMLRDERDLAFVHLSLKMTFTLVPLAALLYMPFVNGWLWWTVAAIYFLLNNVVFKGPFLLMLHCTCHRLWFKKKYNALNYYIPWFLGLFTAQSPDTYFAHHIGMHHAENNLADDKSSTMTYQRDSLTGFMKYFLSFVFIGLIELCQYFFSRNRKKLAYKSMTGELFFIFLCVALCLVNWQATLVVFIVPFFVSRLLMMMGNFAQHAFIDANDPGNDYRNSITCINTPYNRQCFNDGYHISHHEKPAMHWTEHPIYFQKTLDKYIANDAIVFEGLDFMQVFLLLMFKRYDVLAKRFVNLGGKFSSDAQVEAFLRSRTQRIPVSELQVT